MQALHDVVSNGRTGGGCERHNRNLSKKSLFFKQETKITRACFFNLVMDSDLHPECSFLSC